MYPAVDFISSTINSGKIERLIPNNTDALQKEIVKAIRYGLLESASRIEVFS